MTDLRDAIRARRIAHVQAKAKRSTFLDGYKENLETLKRAFADEQICLIHCRDTRTGREVAALAAFGDAGDGEIQITPFAVMVDLETLNALEPPDPEGGFHGAGGWEETEGKEG